MRLALSKETYIVRVGDVDVETCPLSAAEMSRLRDAHTDYRRGREHFDAYDFAKDLFCRVVTGWSDTLVDGDGKPIPCDAAHKALIYEHNPGFAGDVLDGMDVKVRERRDVLEGNLPPGRAGT